MSHIKLSQFVVLALVSGSLIACSTSNDIYRADSYGADRVNTRQQVEEIEIIAFNKATIYISQSEKRRNVAIGTAILGGVAGAMLGKNSKHIGFGSGAIVGAAAGAGAATAMTKDKEAMPGLAITFRQGNKSYVSSQMGKPCEYKLGKALMIYISSTETRIQPNNPTGCR